MLRKTLTPTLEHRYGNHKSVDEAFKRGVYTVPVYTWLGVVRIFLSLSHTLIISTLHNTTGTTTSC